MILSFDLDASWKRKSIIEFIMSLPDEHLQEILMYSEFTDDSKFNSVFLDFEIESQEDKNYIYTHHGDLVV